MERVADNIQSVNENVLEQLKRLPRVIMPECPRTTTVNQEDVAHTVRKLVEFTDYPIETAGGRRLIRRVEKILMPNGRYRYPVTYIDMSTDYAKLQ